MRASCKRENRVKRDGIIVTWFQNLWKSAFQKILKEASPTYRSWNLSTVVLVHQIENLLDVLENNSNGAKDKSGVKNLKTLLVNSSLGLSGVLLHPASSNSFITSCFEKFGHIIAWSTVWHLISVFNRKDKRHWEIWHSHRSSWNSSPPFHSLHTGRATLSPEQFYFHQSLKKKNSACLQILFTGVVHLLVHGSKVDLKKVICLFQVIQINFVL